MDQLLEAISDAVSSMVLYSVEADESNAAIPNILPGAQGVKSTVDYLVDLASKSADLWNNFNQPDMRTKMLDTCNSIKESTATLLEAATVLSNMPFNKPAKKSLLKGAKGIMEHMVVLLQQADLYEVTRLIRSARKAESKLKIFIGLESGESFFKQAAQDFVTSTVDLGKIVNKRVNEIDDFSFKRRFEEANTSLKVEVPITLQYFAYFQSDPNDKHSLNEGSKVAKKIVDIIEEIITVARLSAKSPFDLSMIQGLDLRDEDDLRDVGILISHEKERLLSAIQAGDGKEASRALKAIKKGLNDQIIITKALAKSADPIQKKRLEEAAKYTQSVLDSIIAQFGVAVEELLARPDNSVLLERLHQNLNTIKSASDQMITSSARLTSNDVAEAQRILEELVDKIKLSVAKLDFDQLNVNSLQVGDIYQDVIQLAENIAKNSDVQAVKAAIEMAAKEARQRGSTLIGNVERISQNMVMTGQVDKQASTELNKDLNLLIEAGRELVKVTSFGTTQDLFELHKAIEEHCGKLKQAVYDGNKKDVQSSLRAIRKGLYDELNLAKSIARTTDDEILREALQASILNAEANIQRMIEDLYLNANTAVEDPSNPKSIEALDSIISSIDAMNANLVGAASRDLISNNTQGLEVKLTQLVHSIKNGDQEKSVHTLKAIIEDVKKQAAVAEFASGYIKESDEPRSDRIKERAIDLTSVGPDLVKAVRANLVEMSPENLAALAQSINLVRENNRDLSNAVLLTTEQEILENSAKIDQDMRRIKSNLEKGLPINMNEVNNLMKRMKNQIKLANQHATTIKDPKAKKQLLDSTNNLNKLVSMLVDACKNSAANPNDPEARKQVEELLSKITMANMELVHGSLSAADELVYGKPNILKLINRLEEAVRIGDIDEIKFTMKELSEELTRALFLARIAETALEDPERKKQLHEAIGELEMLHNSLYPSVMLFLSDPNSPEAREALNQLLRKLKGGVERVAATASSNNLEGKSMAVVSELSKLERALLLNDINEANDSAQRALNGIKQQIQYSKHIAEQTSNIPQKRAIIDLSDRLEKQALILQQAVKESIANPKSEAAKAKVSEATAATRVLMAQLIAATSNKVPEEQINATAEALKKDLAQLSAALESGNQLEIAEAIKTFQSGEARQKLELLKAYASHIQDPVKKRAILAAIAELEKKLDETSRSVETLGEKPSAEKIKSLKALVDSSRVSTDAVIQASTAPNEDRILSQAVKISETLDHISNSSKRGNKADVETNLKDLREEINDTVHLIKLASEATRDPNKKVALNEVAEKLKTMSQPLSSAAINSAEKPNDAKLQSELSSLITETKSLLGKAIGNTTNDTNQLLENVIYKASHDVNQLSTAIQSGDQNSIGKAVNSLEDTEKRLNLVSSLVAESKDPKLKESMQKLQTSIPALLSTGRSILTNPKDTQAQKSVQSQSQRAIEDLSAVLAHSNSAPEEKIISNSTAVNREVEGLVSSSKSGNAQSIQSYADTTHQKISEQSILARALAAQTSNPTRKQELLSQAQALEQTLPQLKEASNKLSQNPQDKASAQKLETISSAVKAANQKLVSEAINEKMEKEKRVVEEKIRKDREEAERLQKEKEEREKAHQDEVMAAAQKIQERTKDLVKDDTTSEGKLYSTAQDIAGLMKNLSIAATTNDKKGMIQCSKQLSEQVNVYLSQAKETAAKCTDPKLKEQIITAAQAARNFTVQLKIIAAVKAASEDDDVSSNKQQLVKCAKGLAKAVVQTINSVEVGSIRAKK
eukprot:gene9270-11362_t